MTAAERRALVMLAREPSGVYADPSLSGWRAVLEDLRVKGCASLGSPAGSVQPFYRITPAGISTLYTEAVALEKQANYALGKAHASELNQDKLNAECTEAGYPDEDMKFFNQSTWIAVYDRLAAEARELHQAHDSVGWGEYGPYTKEQHRD